MNSLPSLSSRSPNRTIWFPHRSDPGHQRLSQTTMATICSRPTSPTSRKTSARRRDIDAVRKTGTLLSFKWVTSDGASPSSWKYRWTRRNWATPNGSRADVSQGWVRCIWTILIPNRLVRCNRDEELPRTFWVRNFAVTFWGKWCCWTTLFSHRIEE